MSSPPRTNAALPEELSSVGWRLATTARDLFYCHRQGIKTPSSSQVANAIEAARRINDGRMPGIRVAARKAKTPTIAPLFDELGPQLKQIAAAIIRQRTNGKPLNAKQSAKLDEELRLIATQLNDFAEARK